MKNIFITKNANTYYQKAADCDGFNYPCSAVKVTHFLELVTVTVTFPKKELDW
jgi:hypothetical protein